MKVFISYSVDDTQIVQQIADHLQPVADKVLWWKENKELGREIWPTIFSWIAEADLVLAVITDKTVARAMAVGNEIGHAKAKGKTIIPLIGPGIKPQHLGCLDSITYQPIDLLNPGPAMEAVKNSMASMRAATKLQQQKQLTVFLGIAGLIWALSKP